MCDENVDNSKNIGRFGEKLAEKYLVKNNYKIVEKNFRCKFGEIDIVAFYKKELIFIEVKTRTNNKYGTGINSIDKNKEKHLYKTAEYYLYNKKINIGIRIDAIEITLNKGLVSIKHYKNIILDKPY